MFTASSVDDAAIDGDVAARRIIISAADARGILTASGRDGAVTDGDGAARGTPSAADARRAITASGVERAAALEGEGMALGYVNARIVFSPLHAVGRAFGQNDDGIAQAGDAWPPVVVVFKDGGDVHAAEGHRGAIGNENMGVGTAYASEGVAVMEYDLSRYRPYKYPFRIERHGSVRSLG